ncbi:type VII secretion system-associated protein [Kitasatospora sp. NBC_01287]|uniref:type VII secretion system-associated protein n=1 Tax=Kitasatospora sp. NBC_01287 TaxID=2903573 RepID=UPI00224ED0E7|nr:type VII secretion system-associated protein [Kitasatospora sp. NBC_01287]MCX4750426.1 type VII secretion system-associated protein [Kitasatospora sp. NBC_01287]
MSAQPEQPPAPQPEQRPEPPLSEAMRAAARSRPGSWLYATDPAFGPDEQVPPFGIIGGWQVDAHGEIAGFWHNPKYRPSPQSLGLPVPRSAAEAALQLAATGYGDSAQLLAALAQAPLLLLARPEDTSLYVENGVVDACTSRELVPTTWPGWREVTGRQLASALPAGGVRLNPGSSVCVTIPLADLAEAPEAPEATEATG